jgi:uncharacterized membrane protein
MFSIVLKNEQHSLVSFCMHNILELPFFMLTLYAALLQLILELGPYIEELKKTHGAISEFVNPK